MTSAMTSAAAARIEEETLEVRSRDAKGRPQMAEGRFPGPGGITENDCFFLVHHYQPHEVTPESWSLAIALPSGSERTLTLAELSALPRRKVTALVECAGMSRGYLPRQTPGTQFGHGMVGSAEWEGVSLVDVLDLVGIDRSFRTLILRGGDSGVAQPENEHADFSKGLPLEKALDRDTILALTMNGEPVPWLHGGPVRLVVPGWYGVWWVKWPRRMEVSDADGYEGFWQSTRYTYQDADGRQIAPVRDLLPRAIIETPMDGSRAPKGKLAVAGLAWAGENDIAKVEVTTDGGRSWKEAELAERYGRWTWTRWRTEVAFEGPAGFQRIAARATDSAGRVQAWHSEANRLGYGNNGIHSVRVNIVA